MPLFQVLGSQLGGVASTAEFLEVEKPGERRLDGGQAVVAALPKFFQMPLNQGLTSDEPCGILARFRVRLSGRIAWWS